MAGGGERAGLTAVVYGWQAGVGSGHAKRAGGVRGYPAGVCHRDHSPAGVRSLPSPASKRALRPALTVWLGQAATSLPFVTSGHAAPTAENAVQLDSECEGTLCGNHVAKVCCSHVPPPHVP